MRELTEFSNLQACEKIDPNAHCKLLQELQMILRHLEQLQHKVDVQSAIENLQAAVVQAKEKGEGASQDGTVKEKDVRKKVKKASVLKAALQETLLLWVVFPGLVMLACAVLGAILAGVEHWPWRTGWQYVVSITCGLANPLGNAANVSPTTEVGMISAGVCGMWTIGLTGVISGWASDTTVVAILSAAIRRFCQAEDRHPCRSMLALVLSLFVFSPIALGAFVMVLGCVLSKFEEWPWSDGAYYILANVAGLPNPLVSNTPIGRTGGFTSVIVSLWGFMFSSIIIGLAGAMPCSLPSAEICKCFKGLHVSHVSSAGKVSPTDG